MGRNHETGIKRAKRRTKGPPGTMEEETGIELSREAGGQPGPWGQKAHERLFPRDTTSWIPQGVQENICTPVSAWSGVWGREW